ncbi:YqjF family protein [Nocardioides antri]|uniref:DUF2071 domain-containing protein n=1 Tax=Nocardioides antri TaxID=2607659 RepID=A0A5B1MAA4_9ACTN|nr:DUF2071 domain-containing protein [Nocardioides antri]KAA1428650.1 DUF2071 domain-containing protein [Nocardioides antri]
MVSITAEQHVSVPVLRASWLDMTLVHWPVPPDRVQRLLPAGLRIDEFDGTAWVGWTPFVMAKMRPLAVPDLSFGSSSVPGPRKVSRMRDLSSTAETNLRTYVRGPDGRDGVWFLSLDIGNPVLAAVLRGAVGAPYHYARLTVQRQGDTITYAGSRVGASQSYRLQTRPGASIHEPSGLEVWLSGRWRAYTKHLGRLLVTPVEHEPWPLRAASLDLAEENLTDAVGLSGLSDPPLVHFSDGVHKVRLGRPTLVPGQ